ncbi:MAG: nickel pincer cofactor biosynthesis protein LarC [Lachnospiraceae bacterium]|nr:nickel pincer cofactor biosynthesis protein LarC [Lachnospiraceae bacterium]
MKTLYLECKMGAAGDMLMAALYELIDNKEAFLDKMNHLLPEVSVQAKPAEKCGILGTHMEVKIGGEEELSEDVHEHHHHEEELSEDVHEHHHHHDEEEHGHHHHHHDEELSGEEYEHHHHHHDEEEHEHHHDEEPSGDVHEHHHHHHDEEEHEHHHHHEEDEHGHHHHHVHRSLADMAAIINGLAVSYWVKGKALSVYQEIAKAESAAHGRPVDEVHFHEVGALDAVADITGVCLLMEEIGADRILCSPLNLGNGHVRCAHGILPVPAPATASLVKGIPSYTSDIPGELTTPTGAALLRAFAGNFGPMPTMSVEKTGYGMGMKNFAKANCVRAFLGTEEAGAYTGSTEETKDAERYPGCTGDAHVVELVANLDDMTPEQAGFAMEELLGEGALDVFYQPIHMKKNRPAFLLTCICKEKDADFMAREILRLTTTFGVRKRICDRYTLEVSFEEKDTPWGTVRMKTGKGFGVEKTKPEYEDMIKIMRESGKTWKEIEEFLKSRKGMA